MSVVPSVRIPIVIVSMIMGVLGVWRLRTRAGEESEVGK